MNRLWLCRLGFHKWNYNRERFLLIGVFLIIRHCVCCEKIQDKLHINGATFPAPFEDKR